MRIKNITTEISPDYKGNVNTLFIGRRIEDELRKGDGSQLYQLAETVKAVKENVAFDKYEKGIRYAIIEAGYISKTNKDRQKAGGIYYRIARNQVLKNKIKPIVQFFGEKDGEKPFATSRMEIYLK